MFGTEGDLPAALLLAALLGGVWVVRRVREAGRQARAWENAMRGRFKRDAPEA